MTSLAEVTFSTSKIRALRQGISSFLALTKLVWILLSQWLNLTGQAYILSLKNGSNSIVINGAANEAYDPKMTELDPAWAEAITSCKFRLSKECYSKDTSASERSTWIRKCGSCQNCQTSWHTCYSWCWWQRWTSVWGVAPQYWYHLAKWGK